MDRSVFQDLFGISAQDIQPICLFTPFLSKRLLSLLRIKEWHRGSLYACGQNDHLTLVRTGMGAPMTGDAVLRCQETPLRVAFFLGACGLVEESPSLRIGSLTLPVECLAWESFSLLLRRIPHPSSPSFPDAELTQLFGKQKGSEKISKIKCASVGSLYLEPQLASHFQQHDIQVLDMECSAFYAAAQLTHKKSLALLYATDVLGYPLPTISKPSTFQERFLPVIHEAIDRFFSLIAILKDTKAIR